VISQGIPIGINRHSNTSKPIQHDKTIPINQEEYFSITGSDHTLRIASTDTPVSSDPQKNLQTEGIVENVGLTVSELKALHAKQLRETEQMPIDIDEIIIPSTKNDPEGMTHRDLIALHEQQQLEQETVYPLDEVVVIQPQSGSPGLTAAELYALHERQLQRIESSDDRYEVVIPVADDGSPGLSMSTLKVLHEHQKNESETSTDLINKYIAPHPENREDYLTVEQVRELHKRQLYN
jgi:hypothetical protein